MLIFSGSLFNEKNFLVEIKSKKKKIVAGFNICFNLIYFKSDDMHDKYCKRDIT